MVGGTHHAILLRRGDLLLDPGERTLLQWPHVVPVQHRERYISMLHPAEGTVCVECVQIAKKQQMLIPSRGWVGS